MQTLHLFLPCAAGVESYLAQEVQSICGITTDDLRVLRAGVMVRGNWRNVLLLNLHSRLAQRVLVEVDRKSTRLNSSHSQQSRMPSSA